MSKKPFKPSPYAFVSYDVLVQDDGTRAEVYVQTNEATVSRISEHEDKGVAQVYFKAHDQPHIKYEFNSWVNIDTPVFELVKNAKQTGEVVRFRIESQRKPGVDPSIPIQNLRATAEEARENVKTLLVGVNGIYTSEAVTSPDEDFKDERAVRITTPGEAPTAPTNNASHAVNSTISTAQYNVDEMLERLTQLAASPIKDSLLDAFAAQVLLAGAPIEAVTSAMVGGDKRDNSQNPLQARHSMEAPGWKKYNSDGRLNLGSTFIAGGVGVEMVVHKQLFTLLNNNNVDRNDVINYDEIVDYYNAIVFAICDRVQVVMYGEGSSADRSNGSHIRIRGIVYDLIQTYYDLPVSLVDNNTRIAVDKATNGTWVASLGREAIARYSLAIRHALAQPSFSQIVLPASASGLVEPVTESASTEKAEKDESNLVENTITGESRAAEDAHKDVENTQQEKASEKGHVEPEAAPSALEDTVESGRPETSVIEGGIRPVHAVYTVTKGVYTVTVPELNLTVDTSSEDQIKEVATKLVASNLGIPATRIFLTVENNSATSEVETQELVTPHTETLEGILPPMLLTLEQVEGEELANTETISEFKELFAESGFILSNKEDLARITRLLAYTFGPEYAKVTLIPDSLVGEFIDFYAAAGSESLHAAVNKALGI